MLMLTLNASHVMDKFLIGLYHSMSLRILFWYPEMAEFPNEIIDFGSMWFC